MQEAGRKIGRQPGRRVKAEEEETGKQARERWGRAKQNNC